MIEGGYILQPRKIKESDISKAPPYVREIWHYLLREANSADNKYAGHTISRGQLFRDYKSIREDLAWYVGYRKEMYNENHTKKAMKFLRDTGRITTMKELGGVLITICKYDYYQTPRNYERTIGRTIERTNAEPMQNQPLPDNNKNEKKDKNNKNSLFRQRFFSVLEIFYFKNFNNPIAVTNAFFNHYEGVGWKNARGLDIESVESVAENWENKTTEGANCPEQLLTKWKVMFGILKNNTDHYNKFLLIRPAKLENKTFVIRGKQKDIEAIEADKELLKVWRNALFMTFGKLTIQYELDKQLA
ncbi:hypothetical protein [Draconibacterium mangrovi]|uniref:hypothetical protein n=1 Tax=Draconibacterium mangrovi TaxID=2697469 RepID=UPI0013D39AAF|nr:hypothetical protein [Draconibacterium mangrovi]